MVGWPEMAWQLVEVTRICAATVTTICFNARISAVCIKIEVSKHKYKIKLNIFITYLLCPSRRVGALSNNARLTSVAYIGPKSRTERPRKTKIGIQVAHVM